MVVDIIWHVILDISYILYIEFFTSSIDLSSQQHFSFTRKA